MAEQIISPGYFARENDNSFITRGPVTVGACLIGPSPKGLVGIPTIVTSYSDWTSKFGKTFMSNSREYSFLSNIAVYNYFNNGGTTLLFTRVASGSYSPATSNISGSNATAFTLETLSPGTIMNSLSALDASGSLASGSADNIRWEISQTSTGSGNFTLLIRRGDDNNNQKTVLETWTNLSLDPYSPNYIERIIGNQSFSLKDLTTSSPYIQPVGAFKNNSNYVRVKSVDLATPNYFDNNGLPKSQFTASLPVLSSGSFGGATGTITGAMNMYEAMSTQTQGLSASDYTHSLAILSNKDEYQFNVVTTPGLFFKLHTSAVASVIALSENRGDSISVVDLAEYGTNPTTVVDQASGINSSYAAAYYPWLQTIDPETGQLVWVPASTLIPSIYAFTDKNSYPWFAPAGVNRGTLPTVTQAERKLPQSQRDILYQGKVNPIASLPGFGTVVFGNKTLQTKESALSSVNVRRLIIEVKNRIGRISTNLVFENNGNALRNSFKNSATPELEDIKQKNGLFAYDILMDETNNTNDSIDRLQLKGAISLQPSRTAEYIIIDFNINKTGVTF